MVDSCRECDYCKEDLEQYCKTGATQTYNSPDKYLGTQTYGGYSESIVVDESFVLRVPENLDLAATAPLLCAGIMYFSEYGAPGIIALEFTHLPLFGQHP